MNKHNSYVAVPGDADVPVGAVPAALPAVPGVVPEDTPWDAAYLAAAAEAAAAAALPDPAETIVDVIPSREGCDLAIYSVMHSTFVDGCSAAKTQHSGI